MTGDKPGSDVAKAAETVGKAAETAPLYLRQDIVDACNTIINNQHLRVLRNCISYAIECRYKCIAGYTDKEIRTQILYVLNNMGYWRTADAKKVRETLRGFVKEHADG